MDYLGPYWSKHNVDNDPLPSRLAITSKTLIIGPIPGSILTTWKMTKTAKIFNIVFFHITVGQICLPSIFQNILIKAVLFSKAYNGFNKSLSEHQSNKLTKKQSSQNMGHLKGLYSDHIFLLCLFAFHLILLQVRMPETKFVEIKWLESKHFSKLKINAIMWLCNFEW